MHIVFICNEYPPGRVGGVGIFTQTLARRLVKEGRQVTVLGQYPLRDELLENDCGVHVIRMPSNYFPTANIFINAYNLAARLKKLHQASPIDLIDGPELSMFGLSKSTPGLKVIRMNGGHLFFSTTLGNKPNAGRKWVEQISFGHANYLCAVSKYVADVTCNLLHLENRPIVILPNPVDTNMFCPSLDIPEEDGLIIFIGTVCEKKGIKQLIEAMPEVIKSVPHAHLLVIGRDWRDPQTGGIYREQIQKLIPQEIFHQIKFHGTVENAELPKLIARAQVCIFPSHMESQGIVNIEGMACGKTVISSDKGPGKEFIQDGVTGFLCDPFNPHSIAEKLIVALQNSDLRFKVSRSARKLAESTYSVDVLVKKNLSFYDDCILQKAQVS